MASWFRRENLIPAILGLISGLGGAAIAGAIGAWNVHYTMKNNVALEIIKYSGNTDELLDKLEFLIDAGLLKDDDMRTVERKQIAPAIQALRAKRVATKKK